MMMMMMMMMMIMMMMNMIMIMIVIMGRVGIDSPWGMAFIGIHNDSVSWLQVCFSRFFPKCIHCASHLQHNEHYLLKQTINIYRFFQLQLKFKLYMTNVISVSQTAVKS